MPQANYRSTRFDPGLVKKWISFEINALPKDGISIDRTALPSLLHAFAEIEKFGGPDLSQMEPTDQLDAPDRGSSESRVKRLQTEVRSSGTPNSP